MKQSLKKSSRTVMNSFPKRFLPGFSKVEIWMEENVFFIDDSFLHKHCVN